MTLTAAVRPGAHHLICRRTLYTWPREGVLGENTVGEIRPRRFAFPAIPLRYGKLGEAAGDGAVCHSAGGLVSLELLIPEI